MSEFVVAAEAVCIATSPKVAALGDPDSVGGQKQLGLGKVVREWAEELAAITAPSGTERSAEAEGTHCTLRGAV